MQRLRGANLRPRPGAAPDTRGGGLEEQHLARGQSGNREEQPHSQGVVAVGAQEGLEEPSHVEDQEGQWEEIPLIQGKFAGAAVNRYPTSKVREIQVRW